MVMRSGREVGWWECACRHGSTSRQAEYGPRAEETRYGPQNRGAREELHWRATATGDRAADVGSHGAVDERQAGASAASMRRRSNNISTVVVIRSGRRGICRVVKRGAASAHSLRLALAAAASVASSRRPTYGKTCISICRAAR